MLTVRPSVPADVPVQRELWKLAFGDSDEYIGNFYSTYYRPDRVVVLEEDGTVKSMTAWFDTAFVVPGQGEYRAAYLYAVATHPDCRGRGLAARLLAGADEYFRSLGIPAVTTVPAEPSLHNFFGANGFRECFVHDPLAGWRENFPGTPAPPPSSLTLEPLSPAQYGALREELLAGIPHIAYPEDALAYQAGCCALSGGGMYRIATERGDLLACVERTEDDTPLVKELLGPPPARALFLQDLPALLRADIWALRVPHEDGPVPGHRFGMLKWLDPEAEKVWNWDTAGYLGLAFD